MAPSAPPSPSFTPAAGTGALGAGGSEPAAPVPARRERPAQARPRGNGWDGSESAQALPVRGGRRCSGNGSAAPANGAADDGADQTIPRIPAASAGPGGSRESRRRAQQAARLRRAGPAGAQGPRSAARTSTAATVPARAARRRTAPRRTDGADPKADSGQVTVPPPATPDQRLPIFDSLESDWFRRSGKTVSTARPSAQGSPRGQGRGGRPAGRAVVVDLARRRRLACGPGARGAGGGRYYAGGPAEAGAEG